MGELLCWPPCSSMIAPLCKLQELLSQDKKGSLCRGASVLFRVAECLCVSITCAAQHR